VRNTIQYCSVGAAEGIGASSHYLGLDRWGLLLDAGLDPHRYGEDALPLYDHLFQSPVDAILISHAHLDHIGSLPVAIQKFPRARVYMTPATADLCEIMLYHYLKVQRKQAQENWIPFHPYYSEEYLGMIRFLFQSFPYNTPFPLHGQEESSCRFTFYDAGHILGSAGILIEWRDRRIFYTGNVRLSPQFLLKGAQLPEPVDTLILESTYGANTRAETIRRTEEINRLAKLVNDQVKLGGIILIPVFALGRTQEMLMLLHQLRQHNRIPAVPFYIAGFGLAINRLYDRLLHKIYPQYQHGYLRTIPFGRWSRHRPLKGPAILISTSGMLLPGSASFDFTQHLIQDPRNALCLVGYADPETPGGYLRSGNPMAIQAIFNVNTIAARLEIFHFSAHSHRQELLRIVQVLKPKTVVLVHGDKEALQWMKENISRRWPHVNTIIPTPGTWYTL